MRQAHPGPGVPPYRTFEQKWEDGQAYKLNHQIPWPILVDDLLGRTHQVYGGLSDPIYLLDLDGRVSFYNMFANAPAVHEALEELFLRRRRGIVRGGIDRFPHLGAALTNGWPGLARGLPQSFNDLMVATPGSPIAVLLGWQLRQLLGPLTLRATPLPLPLRLAFYLVGAVVLAMLARRMLPGGSASVRERTTQRDVPQGTPKPIPAEAEVGERPMQLTADGTGKLYHHRYRADIAAPTQTAETLMRLMQRDPNDFSPTILATWEKIAGAEDSMQVGDEYYIHITGPWDGPVRVIDVAPTSFSLITLEGHFEAGEIRFRFIPHPTQPDALRFEILSWARSRDAVVDFAYDQAKVVKIAQTSMWVHFCERAVEESGGKLIDKIDVLTEEAPFRGEVIPRE
ncbi:MAG: DUF1990 family protein [Ardenticatenales bacterium]|nr:DUF1990 family protein [Ardenticatenales bacterium]